MNNIIAYNVSVHSNNLKNGEKVPDALHYLLKTPIDIATFQRFEIRKRAETYQKSTDDMISDKAQHLIRNIDRLERSQAIDSVVETIFGLELDEIDDEDEDDLLDEEIQGIMMCRDDDTLEDQDIDRDRNRPVNKLFTEQCQDSPRHQAQRASLLEKINVENATQRTPSPSPGRAVHGRKKGLETETPRFCPIRRSLRFAFSTRRPMRDIFGIFEEESG